jgi:hypothetical protein
MPMPVREAAESAAVVLVGTSPIAVADSDSAETVLALADKLRAAKKAVSKAEERGEQWRLSGEHWDRLAAWYADRQAANAKRHAQAMEEGKQAYPTASEGRTITLAGFGARLTVKGSSLQVASGRTYSTEKCKPETLYRGIHGVSSIL